MAGALGAVLLVGTALLSSSPVGAQQAAVQRTATTSAAPLNNVTYNVVRPAFATYYQQHGGVRTFGPPLSNDFQLLGLRVQILQNQVLQQHPDGSITAMDLLNKALPLAHADGLTFPTPDPDMAAALPSLTSPTYVDDALATIDGGWLDQWSPDSWYDLPINFNTTFRSTITCDDLPAEMPCDDRTLLRGALDVWGLPIGAVTQDPNDPNHIYQRFQRGIMQYNVADGTTSAVPVGDYFRRVLQDQGVSDDLRADLTGSRFLGEYAPSQPLGVAHPLDLPATSLTAAFTNAGSDSSSSTTTSAFDSSATSATSDSSATTVGTPAAGATSPFGAALPSFGQTTDPSLVSGTPTPVLPAGTPGAAVTSGTPVAAASTPSPTAAPAGPDPCAGDEQIMFSPPKPYANTDVLISVTSARHHNSSSVRLTGPVKPGNVTERQGLNGWVWEWTVTPSVEGWYEFSFFTDGARKCATSGFNVLPAFGTTATPTPAAVATLAPVTSATATPTPTVGAPSVSGTNPPSGGACQGSVLQLTGSNFGASQSELQGQVIMNIPGGSRAATVLVWTSNSIMVTLPTPLAPGDYQIFVATTAGTSAPLTYKVGAC